MTTEQTLPPHMSHFDWSPEETAAIEAYASEAVRNALATQAPTPEPDSRWMWKHVKSGGEYMRMANAKLQTDTPLQDMAELVIYRGADGLWWARPVSEFEGRFKRSQPIPRAAPQAPALTDEQREEILDAADDWAKGVIEDRCAMTLRKHLEPVLCALLAVAQAPIPEKKD